MSGVSTTTGYTVSHPGEAAMMADMMRKSRRVVVLADSSKFGVSHFAHVAALDAADVLVTDTKPEPEFVAVCQQHDVELLY